MKKRVKNILSLLTVAVKIRKIIQTITRYNNCTDSIQNNQFKIPKLLSLSV